ncbi:MAG: DUF1295 domain-containing protein [Bacteroidales bacterium]
MKKSNKTGSLIVVAMIYLLAVYIGWLVLQQTSFQHSMINIFVADVAATLIVFLFSFLLKNSSVYDPYWSVIPPFIAVFLIFNNPHGNFLRQYIMFGLILFWAMRLTANWARGWTGLNHEDWRYKKIAADTGKFYWPVSFIGIHLMPTLFVFLGCLPLWFTMSSHEPFNFIDIIAILITLIAVFVEWIADEQLRKYKKQKKLEPYMRSGLWSLMRHPNYFGEILFWTGLYLFVFATKNYNGWWTAVGFVSMIILFKFISIPLMEKRNMTNRPGYENYIREVNALLPLKKFKVR